MLCSVKRRGKRRLPTVIVVILLLATLTFIWSNSLRSEQVSSAESAGALGLLGPLLEFFFGSGNVTDHLVRKLAHFAEFGALGCELTLLVFLRCRLSVQAVLNGLAAGLVAAVTDEALQLLSGRGSMVQDVLLDFSGVLAGMAVVLFICAVRAAVRRSRGTGRWVIPGGRQ